MRSLRFALCSVALASVVGLAACGSDDDGIGATTTTAAAASSTPESAPATTTTVSSSTAASTPSAGELTLEGVTWTLSDETDLGVDLAGVDVTARFLEGQVAGNSGCNQYTGTYVLSGDELTIKPGASTMMACPAPQSAVEAAYLKVLPNVASYAIEDDTLTLSDTSGAAVLVFEHVAGDQLLAGDWTVSALRTANAVSSPVQGSELTMTFADGSVSGNAGCNNFNGSVTIDGDSLTFGPLASTRMACTDDALTQQETDFLAALGNTASFSARGDTVTLLADDGTITVTLARSS